MPRFSDVFVYEKMGVVDGNFKMLGYHTCYMLKPIGGKKTGDKVEAVIFDVDGMFIMIQDSDKAIIGPFCLTI